MARADHIKVKRRGRGYWHHGIDVGDGWVIHFSGEPGRMYGAQIKCSTMEEFLRGGTPEVVPYTRAYAPEVVIERAKSRIGEKGYHLIFNNCEHFARWCKSGELSSEQVKTVAAITQVAAETLVRISEKSPKKAGRALAAAGKAMSSFAEEMLKAKVDKPLPEIEGPMVEIKAPANDQPEKSDDRYLREYSPEGFWSKLKHYAKAAGEEVVCKSLQLYYAAQEPQTPRWAKATIYAALGYFICPIDAIPDLTPLVGYADDLGVLAAAIATVTLYVTPAIRERARRKSREWFE